MSYHRIAITIGCILAFFVLHTISASPVFAQSGQDQFGLQPIEQTTALGTTDVRIIVMQIIRAILGLLGIIALVLILYAGYLIMTAAGNEEKVAEGKRILINATIGIAIILASFSIVQFILNSLARATGTVTRSPLDGGPPVFQTFEGSGALGQSIRDHYPFRDEQGVKRNTRISVTFGEPIDPASFIVDTNQNGTIGDCRTPAPPTLVNWATDCDQLNTDVVRIFATDLPEELIESAALVLREGAQGDIFTVVFRPIAPLGSDIEPVDYTVDLGSGIQVQGRDESIFANDASGHYLWTFETDTTIDVDPPTITSVYPTDGSVVPRNSIVQIHFSEAMDPGTVQGIVGQNSSFSHIVFGSAAVEGNWRVTNGYRTVEFVSSLPCGQNSCGEEMYCLPASAACGGGTCNAVLVRTAALISQNSFSAFPFTGVTDMAGNALNGDGDRQADGKPPLPGDVHTIGSGELVADNDFWSFTVSNNIDRLPPYIRSVSPGIDQEDVPENASTTITFSTRMWMGTFGAISLVERMAPSDPPVANLWHRTRATTNSGGQTVAEIDHRVFGPNGVDAYYFPIVSSTVKSVSQNCLYPGRGPVSDVKNESPVCVYEQDDQGVPLPNTGEHCISVVRNNPAQDTGCVQTANTAPEYRIFGTLDTCLQVLQTDDISPL